MRHRVEVRFDVPREVAFDYLVDPGNRPAWQSSLRAVDLIDPEPLRVGSRWRDRTVVGAGPQMTLTALERPDLWAESGAWRGISANLSLSFADDDEGRSLVTARMGFFGDGPWRLLAGLLSRVAPTAVQRDLERASRRLGKG